MKNKEYILFNIDDGKTYRRMGYEYLTKNIQVYELGCKDGSQFIAYSYLNILELQRLREHIRTPLHFNSSFRTLPHNIAEDGSRNSNHLYGKAHDIWAYGFTGKQLWATCVDIELKMKGYGIYSNRIHVDSGKERIYFG